MPLYNSSEVFVPAKQYGSDSLDIKKTERDALLCPYIDCVRSYSKHLYENKGRIKHVCYVSK